MSTEQPGLTPPDTTPTDVAGIAEAVATEVALAIVQGVLASIAILGAFISAVWHLLDKIWSSIIKPFLSFLESVIDKLHKIYNKIIRPILKQIEKQRQLIRRIYAIYFRPILETIAAIRAFLAITRLNQTAFGKALDGKLASLEAKIYAPIKALLQAVNDQARFINILLGPDLLFQQATHLQSIVRDMGHIADAFYNLSRVPSTALRDGTLARISPATTPAQERDAFKQLLQSDAGFLAETFPEDNTTFRNTLAA